VTEISDSTLTFRAIAAPAQTVPGTGGEAEPASVLGNPFSLHSSLGKLEIALNEIISALENEGSSVGSSASEESLLSKFKSWRAELVAMQKGSTGFGGTRRGGGDTAQEGGLFTD
jgi:hypothetical protein